MKTILSEGRGQADQSDQDCTSDSVKEQLRKIIPSLGTVVTNTSSSPLGENVMEQDKDVEFITAVPADQKKGVKRKSLSGKNNVNKKTMLDKSPTSVSSDINVNNVKEKQNKNDFAVNSNNGKSESSKEDSSESNQRNIKDTEVEQISVAETKTKNRPECEFCHKTYQNKQGLYIHIARMHKSEKAANSPAEEDQEPVPVVESVYSEVGGESTISGAVCKCGVRFDTKRKLKNHSKKSCQASEEKSEEETSTSQIVHSTLKSLSPALEELAAHSEDEKEINRRLFMENLANNGSDEEDDDLEIIDFSHGPSRPNTVKSEPCVQKESINLEESVAAVSDKDEDQEEWLKKLKGSPYFQDHPRLYEVCPKENLSKFKKENRHLKDWKLEHTKVRRNGVLLDSTHFLSPARIILKSGVAVLEYHRLVCDSDHTQLRELATKMKVKEKNWESYREKYLSA